MIFPLKIELDTYQTPVSNYILVFLTLAAFIFSKLEIYSKLVADLTLLDNNAVWVFANIFIYGSLFGFIFNILFLIVFGGAVCIVFGNYLYPFIYLLLGGIAGTISLLIDGNPSIGANGAIAGLMGMVLAWFPKNKIKVVYFLWFYYMGSFKLQIIFAVLIYFALMSLNLLGANPNSVIYAEIGGLVVGFLIGIGLLYTKIVTIDEVTILDIVNKKEKEVIRKNYDELQAEAEQQRFDDEMVKLGLVRGSSLENLTELDFQINRAINQKEAVPKFRVLRLIKNENEIKCFFVNEGDSITNLYLSSSEGVECLVTPNDEIKSSETGVLTFNNLKTNGSKIKFTLSYNNSINIVSGNYIFDSELKSITEV